MLRLCVAINTTKQSIISFFQIFDGVKREKSLKLVSEIRIQIKSSGKICVYCNLILAGGSFLSMFINNHLWNNISSEWKNTDTPTKSHKTL